MLSKSADTPYCNVSRANINSAKPILNGTNLAYLKKWITQRYDIHLEKDVLVKPAPWTSNNVLQNYRFCNVRREHDRESRWLIHNVCQNDNLSYKNKLLNCVLFRLINKSETISIFGVLDFDNLNYELIRERLSKFEEKNPGYVYFSSAFFMSGPKVVCNKVFGKGGSMVVKMIRLVERYYKEGILEKIKGAENQRDVYLALRSFQGFGEFLAYQIFVDFCYILDFPFSENEFTVAGPGCKRGLELIFDDFDGLNYEETLFWLKDNQDVVFGENFGELFSDLDEHDKYLNVMSLENCMCEISKYIRAATGTGRPRNRYKGR